MADDLMARIDDLIDGADCDRSVSQDAMRWMPELRAAPLLALCPEATSAQINEAVRLAGERMRRFAEAFGPVSHAYLESMKAIGSTMARLFPIMQETKEAQRAEQRRVHVDYRRRQVARRRRRRG